MDFIVELPKSKDMTIIMVVVDRLTKMDHFIPLRCLPTTSIDADAFINSIFKLHGFPDSIISDRGTQFTSEFWNRLCDLSFEHRRILQQLHSYHTIRRVSQTNE